MVFGYKIKAMHKGMRKMMFGYKINNTVNRPLVGGLKIYCLNINSLPKHVDDLRIMVEEFSPHIICLNETKLNRGIGNDELRIEGYHEIIRKDRSRHGGGVAMYVRNELSFTTRHDLVLDIESLSIQLDIKYVKLIIVSTLYRRPDSLVELFKPTEELISSIDQENKECIVAGDFNCDLLKPDQNNPKHIKRIYKTYGFRQVIEKPTRTTSNSKTLIDHIASNRPECVSESGVIPCGISDHDIVYLIRSMRVPRIKKEPKTITVRKCKRFDEKAYLSELNKLQFDKIRNLTEDPDEMWVIWKNWFLNVLKKHAPLSDVKIKGNNLPYITMDVRQMIGQRDYLKKMANKIGSPILRQAFQQIRNKVQYRIRKLRADYYSKTMEQNKGNLRKTWKVLKQASNKDVKVTKINQINHEGNTISEEKTISNTFNNHFVSVGDKLASNIPSSS